MRSPSSWLAIAVAAVVLVSGLGMLTGGVFELTVLQRGTPAKATVYECREVGGRYTAYSCLGTWVSGGPLVGGNGRVVTGTVDGATPSDVGKTVDVRLWGDRAYTTSLRVPIVLLVLGLVMVAAGVGVALPGAWPPSPKAPRR